MFIRLNQSNRLKLKNEENFLSICSLFVPKPYNSSQIYVENNLNMKTK